METEDGQDPLKESLPNVYEGIRKSGLFLSLHEKLGSTPSGEVGFLAEFASFSDVIREQIGETRALFPEFTPHDERLHIAKLFYIADIFLGRAVYKQMSAAELFLLASGLYAHDWGMAVGNDELQYLKSGGDAKLQRDSFAPLPDEKQRLLAFAQAEGLIDIATDAIPELSNELLRIYVRNTHARRSASRVRSHFVAHRGIGEAIAQICEGHWHDFGTLDDPDRFPHEYSLGRESVHLLALTLYVRLIDLFHITEDRTPYALWRFISPRDNRSALEWKKHEALHGISVFEFNPGRAIRVQGSTEDEEVWAGLQDLKHYCDEQVHRTLDLSARHVPQRYSLDFIRLEWAVKTGTLKPVDLRFEFNRNAMFRILSDDIYEGDPYVFLRELLQNAIDATRTRRARLTRRKQVSSPKKTVGLNLDTTIYFTATHEADGNIVVSCRDNGIGMDEHVIRNYFTVAGVSYYRSSEFERQHLGFEPISRFGVGILSVFMVADKLEVNTYRDPECSPPMADTDLDLPGSEQHRARRLNLQIPAVDRQFVVRDGARDLEVGTEVTVRVSAHKIAQLIKPRRVGAKDFGRPARRSNGTFVRSLEVAEYLQDIAGFVEFPIHVTEHWPGRERPVSLLILHPNHNAQEEAEQYGADTEVSQLKRVYPWEQVTEAESRDAAIDLMTVREVDLEKAIPGGKYQGWILFPKPLNESWDFTDNDRNPVMIESGPKVHFFDRDSYKAVGTPINWNWQQYADIRDFPMRMLLGVYRDGIRLPGVIKANWGRMEQVFPLPQICVNLPASSTTPPNLARTSITGDADKWDVTILAGLHTLVAADEIAEALSREPAERLFRLGWLAQVFRLSDKELLDMVPEQKLPVPWIDKGGVFEVTSGVPPEDAEVFPAPEEVTYVAQLQALRLFSGRQLLKTPHHWEGPRSLVHRTDDARSRPASLGINLVGQWIAKHLIPVSEHFLTPPAPDIHLLSQLRSRRFTETIDEEIASSVQSGTDQREATLNHPKIVEALLIAVTNPEDMSFSQRFALHRVFSFIPRNIAALPIRFTAPFDHFAVTSSGDVNLLHPFGREFLRALGAIGLAERAGKIRDKEIAKLNKNFVRRDWLGAATIITFNTVALATNVFAFVSKYNLIPSFVAPPIPQPSEVVPTVNRGNGSPIFPWRRKYDPASIEASFGQPITNITFGREDARDPTFP